MSERIVLKFGGTSVATPGRVRLAARRVRAHVRRGGRVVVVVSAAGHTTDGLLRQIDRLGGTGAPEESAVAAALVDAASALAREVDRALATGEDRSAALLAVALWKVGVPARSLRGGEAGVRAEGAFGAGEIGQLFTERVHRLLEGGIVPVVSGFQGERSDGETITLGRGGSDTSAVALAAALGGVPCHIVTDVAGVFDRDPNLDPGARAYAELDYPALITLVESGAQVVHPTAARLAARARVPLHVYSFRAPWSGKGGTRIPSGSGAARTPEFAA